MKPCREFSNTLIEFIAMLYEPQTKAQVYSETLTGLSMQELIILNMQSQKIPQKPQPKMKTCTTCKEPKTEDCFYKHSPYKGTRYMRHQCQDCYRERSRERYHIRKQLNQIKQAA